MLSNTDDKKPRPNAVCHEAAGNCSTGIIDALNTSESKNTEPLKAPGNRLHSGLRSRAVSSSATHTAAPRNGNRSDTALKRRFTVTLTTTAATRMNATTPTRTQSTGGCEASYFWIGAKR